MEWAVATFDVWSMVPDLLLRGVMWRIPSRLRRWWDLLNGGALLRGGEYTLGYVQAGLDFHDQNSWIGGEEMGPKKGKIHREWGIVVERRGEQYTVIPSRPSNRTMAKTAEFKGDQRASRNVGDHHVHEKPPGTLEAEADGWNTRMVTGLRSAPQADIGVVIETRVGAQPHMSGWD
jgi:hypothetical protein